MGEPSVWSAAQKDQSGTRARTTRRVLLLMAILALTACMAMLRHQGGPLAMAAGPIGLALVPLCYAFIRLEEPARPGKVMGLPAAS